MQLRSMTNQKGSGLLSSLIVIVMMALSGFSVASLMSADSTASTNEMQSVQALQVGGAGLEYALERLDNGYDPSVQNKPFGRGIFSVQTDPTSQTVTVVASVGPAKRTQTVNANFAEDCNKMDVTTVMMENKSLTGLEVQKTCNTAAIVDAIQVNWNWSLCAKNLTCTGTTGTDNPNPDPDAGKQTLCHIPPGNQENMHTIMVGQAAVNAHLNHGDVLGACAAGDDVANIVDCKGYEQEATSCESSDGNAKIKTIKVNGAIVADNLTANRNAIIDVQDTLLSANQAYKIDEIAFDMWLPEQMWYSVTVHFKDGSKATGSFKFSDD